MKKQNCIKQAIFTLVFILALSYNIFALQSVKDLRVEETEKEIICSSPWLKVSFPKDRPGISFLALDDNGLGRLSRNLLKLPQGGDLVAIDPIAVNNQEVKSFKFSHDENIVQYKGINIADKETVDLIFTVEDKGIKIKINRDIPHDYHTNEATPFRLLFDPSVTPPSPMGRLKASCELQFPVLLHFPDHGSLLVRSKSLSSSWMFSFGPRYKRQLGKNLFEWVDAFNRDNPHEVQLALRQGWKPVHDRIHTDVGMQSAGQQEIELDMTLTEVYPEKAIVDKNPKLQGIKKAWLNSYQFRPDLQMLSNNVISDNCAFTLYQFADQAYFTPPLFDDFTAMDLVRTTLEKYFAGAWSYGQNVLGFSYFKDIDPSIIIASWDYVSLTNDDRWLRHHMSHLNKFTQNMIDFDLDGDGIAESISDGNVCTGNSGSGDIGQGAPSVMWWDQIGFGWKDAYSTALHYRAFLCMADFERRLGNTEKAQEYTKRAEIITSLYYKTFYNPVTGVLGGWRSMDGELHDYYFMYVNGIAISYGLIPEPEANKIMDKMQAKIKQAGFTNFRIGLPGNLVPVPKKDMAGWPAHVQPGDFQIYGNGGVSGNHAYLYIQALYSLGRTAEADHIFYKMLEGYHEGVFQGGINFNGHGKGLDWKKWDGSPCGYEGYLVDNYFALTCFITGRLKHGIPFPEKIILPKIPHK